MVDDQSSIIDGNNKVLEVKDDENDDDDDDEIANLFSFAVSGASDSVGSNIPCDGIGNGGTIASSSNPAHSIINASSIDIISENERNIYRKQSNDSHDPFMEMLDAESSAILSLSRIMNANESNPREKYDAQTLELLDWLDASGVASREVDGTTEEIIFDSDAVVENTSSSTSIEPDGCNDAHPPPPTFDTLEEALLSKLSSNKQVRELAGTKLQKGEPLFANTDIARTLRPELYCRMICGGKTLSETTECSLADSFEHWKSKVQQNTDTNKIEIEVDKLGWVHKQVQCFSQNIATSTGKSLEECEIDLSNLLLYSYYNNYQKENNETQTQQQTLTTSELSAKPSNNNTESKTSSDICSNTPTIRDKGKYMHDSLIPAVAATILAANIPVAAASVVLSQIVPNFMPLLGLQPSERWDASLLLHAEFYILACYHIPLLVYHLDRHLPGWHWPRNGVLVQNGIETTNKENNSNIPIKKTQTNQGQVPPSWLICHLAGEINYGDLETDEFKALVLNPPTLLHLWDGILTSSNSHSTRYFLTLALLEYVGDKLILLTGDELAKELQSVWTVPEKYFPPEIQWHERRWWDHAQALQRQTPKSVIRKTQQSEDEAIKEALRQRRIKAEAIIQSRLDAEAAAHKLAQELAAQQARERLSRARLVAFYREHAPDKEANIDMILSAYAGRLHLLDQKLKAKYGRGFNPALDPKRIDDVQEKKSASNMFLATVNQGLSAIGRQKVVSGEETASDDDVFSSPKIKDQVSVSVSPDEVLPILCWSKDAVAVRGNQLTTSQTISYWENLKFYLVDSRTEENSLEQGRFPTALEITPEFLMDPDRIRENEDRIESLRGACHIVVMGEGYSAIPKLYNQKLSPKLEMLAKLDEARTNSCALFFCKKGFPFVSILEDGFAGALSWLYREGSRYQLYPSSVLVDYNPDQSLFGQLETLHNSTASEKAQRKMQKLLESSLVTMTKHATTLEKLTSAIDGDSEKDTNTTGGTLQVLRLNLFNRSETSVDVADKNEEKNADDSLRKPGFLNQFVTLGGKKEDMYEGNPTPTSPQMDMTQTPTNDASSKMPVNNPFKGLGAAFNNTLKNASTMASNNTSTSSSSNNDISQTVPVMPNMLKRNPFARFTGPNASIIDEGKKNPPSTSNSGTGAKTTPVVVPGFGSFNQFRKTTFARMQAQRDPSENIPFDLSAGPINEVQPKDKESAKIAKV